MASKTHNTFTRRSFDHVRAPSASARVVYSFEQSKLHGTLASGNSFRLESHFRLPPKSRRFIQINEAKFPEFGINNKRRVLREERIQDGDMLQVSVLAHARCRSRLLPCAVRLFGWPFLP